MMGKRVRTGQHMHVRDNERYLTAWNGYSDNSNPTRLRLWGRHEQARDRRPGEVAAGSRGAMRMWACPHLITKKPSVPESASFPDHHTLGPVLSDERSHPSSRPQER